MSTVVEACHVRHTGLRRSANALCGARDRAGSYRPLRVTQVVSDNDRRGAQVFARDLEADLKGARFDVRTVALTQGAVGGLGVGVLGPSRFAAATIAGLRREFGAADLVIAHGSSTLPACALAGARTQTPFVYRQVSDPLYWADTPVRRLRVRLGLRRAHRVVALWDGTATTLADEFGVPVRAIDVIPNGVPAMRFAPATDAERSRARSELGVPPASIVVSYVGALAPEKDVGLAIRAVSGLDGVMLVIAGDGPDRSALEGFASVSGSLVRFTGQLDNARTAYAAADLVVLPSRSECMPATLIEGGLMRLPVVSTRVAAMSGVVEDGVTGLLTESGNSAELTSALHRLAENADLRDRLGAAARRRCLDRYSITSVSQLWAETITRTVASASSVQRDESTKRRRTGRRA